MTPARKPAASRRRNSAEGIAAAEQLSQAWHGRAPRTIRELEEVLEVRSDFADLGGLEELVVCGAGYRYTLRFGHDVRLGGVLNREQTAAVQIYLIGGDQAVDLESFGITDPHDREVLGAAESICYVTKKDHLDNVEAPYEHEFGEEGGEPPLLIYDTLNQKLEFVGGSYTIKLNDYDGKHSAGIRN